MVLRLACTSISMLILAAAVAALQAPVRVDMTTAMKQIVKQIAPTFPPDVVATNPAATLAADVIIRADGTVESVNVIVGPEALRAPAIAALKQWIFRPFTINGRPTRMVTLYSIVLPDPKADAESKSAGEFFDAEPTCLRSLAAQSARALSSCRELVRLSDLLPDDRQLERSHAHAYLGAALLQQNRTDEALSQFEHALQLRRRRALAGKLPQEDADADDADLMAIIARMHVRLGHAQEATDFFEQSIGTFERAIVAIPSLCEKYVQPYSAVLRDYAAFKRTSGLQTDARALETRASGLTSRCRAPV